MYIKDAWVNKMSQSIKLARPDLSSDKIEKLVTEMFDKNFTDHNALIYNNYENTVADTSLAQVLDWFQTDNPLIAESGVYFYPKHVKRNVNIEIIKENMLDARNIHKREKFECLERGDTFGAAVKDIQQANDKKAANSGYGAEAESSSFLYNLHSAMSVTSCGRGQLATACQCFENLLGDNVKFFDMTEFFNWVTNIINESDDWRFDIDDVISIFPDKKRFIKRFVGKFIYENTADTKVIGNVYDSLSAKMAARVYYKANIREFLLNFRPMKLYSDIGATNIDFIDPNEIPAKLYEKVTLLTELVTEFVNYKHSMFRYEDRTKYLKRNVVTIMD